MDMSEPTRILIVDDSEDDSLLISRQLSREAMAGVQYCHPENTPAVVTAEAT